MRMAGIPDDDWWRFRRVHYPDHDHNTATPTAHVSNADERTFVAADGTPLFTVSNKPPVGYQRGEPRYGGRFVRSSPGDA